MKIEKAEYKCDKKDCQVSAETDGYSSPDGWVTIYFDNNSEIRHFCSFAHLAVWSAFKHKELHPKDHEIHT